MLRTASSSKAASEPTSPICRDIDIAESGLFKGAASIDDAEIWP